ncbi:MAG: hypothetical protein K2N47_04210 [Clostridia bacterium]|nr:hypothetical protein [Clostridia bacterium]
MRVYFLSSQTAGLKLNGAYVGIIGIFEKFVDLDIRKKILAEVLPEGEGSELRFFIDENLLKNPPDFLDVYLTDGDIVAYVKRYPPRTRKLKVVAQERLGNILCTLFLEGGGVYLSCDGGTCRLYELSAGFENATLKCDRIGGHPVIVVDGEGCLAIISESGERVFYNPAESYSCGDMLGVTVNFATCAACKAECKFGYDGREMTLKSSKTRESAPIEPEIMHFAFFESVLTHGDFAKYLSEELRSKRDILPSFLGEYVDVTVPYAKFFERHGDVKAAGLVYPLKGNLFEIKYFAVDVENGIITNVYEVE